MNTNLAEQVSQAEGRYLSDSELTAFQNFIDGHRLRLSAYKHLKEQGDSLIVDTLRSLMPSHRKVIQNSGDLCKRDMSYVLRYAAFSMLKDDENSFREELVLWMQNILSALHKQEQSVQFYSTLQTMISQQLPTNEAELINYYLTIFIDSLKTGKA